jgi:uncharacterized protein DUF1413
MALLTKEEIAQAVAIVRVHSHGTFELRQIYGAKWEAISSPTTFGKRFKATVEAGLIPGIHVSQQRRRSDNHHTYTISREA